MDSNGVYCGPTILITRLIIKMSNSDCFLLKKSQSRHFIVQMSITLFVHDQDVCFKIHPIRMFSHIQLVSWSTIIFHYRFCISHLLMVTHLGLTLLMTASFTSVSCKMKNFTFNLINFEMQSHAWKGRTIQFLEGNCFKILFLCFLTGFKNTL